MAQASATSDCDASLTDADEIGTKDGADLATSSDTDEMGSEDGADLATLSDTDEIDDFFPARHIAPPRIPQRIPPRMPKGVKPTKDEMHLAEARVRRRRMLLRRSKWDLEQLYVLRGFRNDLDVGSWQPMPVRDCRRAIVHSWHPQSGTPGYLEIEEGLMIQLLSPPPYRSWVFAARLDDTRCGWVPKAAWA